MRQGSTNVVQEKNDLESKKGDAITIGLIPRSDAPVLGDGEALEGNEDNLDKYYFTITVEEKVFALRDRGPLDRQRAVYDMDMESRDAMKVRGAEYLDQRCFDALQDTPTKTIYGGSATLYTNIAATDLITTDLISRVKAGAKTGFNRTQTPLRPVRVGGKDYFIMLVHPDALYDLKQDSAFQQARREAEVRSKENPIFSDAYAIWDGVVIHEHENIAIAKDGGAGANIPTSKNLFLGQQALVMAWASRPKIVAAEFDYGREHGFSWQAMFNVKKPKFNSLDYGAISVHTARTSVSDA